MSLDDGLYQCILCRMAAVISLFGHWIYPAHSPIMERTAAFP
jgi:hypothetical protein